MRFSDLIKLGPGSSRGLGRGGKAQPVACEANGLGNGHELMPQGREVKSKARGTWQEAKETPQLTKCATT